MSTADAVSRQKLRAEGVLVLRDHHHDLSAEDPGDLEAQALKLACPFYKHDPRRYSQVKTCLGPGFTEFHRVKYFAEATIVHTSLADYLPSKQGAS